MYGAFNLKIKENPRIVGALPDLMLKKWREIEERGGTPTLEEAALLGRGGFRPGRAASRDEAAAP